MTEFQTGFFAVNVPFIKYKSTIEVIGSSQ